MTSLSCKPNQSAFSNSDWSKVGHTWRDAWATMTTVVELNEEYWLNIYSSDIHLFILIHPICCNKSLKSYGPFICYIVCRLVWWATVMCWLTWNWIAESYNNNGELQWRAEDGFRDWERFYKFTVTGLMHGECLCKDIWSCCWKTSPGVQLSWESNFPVKFLWFIGSWSPNVCC